MKKNTVKKSDAYLKGLSHYKMGYSIYYNPYRNKESNQKYIDWINGWKEAQG